MKARTRLFAALAGLAGVGALFTSAAVGQAEFGTEADVEYAATLWQALDVADLVGDRVIHGTFYQGVEPHGFVLETLFATLTLDGFNAPVIVKRNYGPAGVAIEDVDLNPQDHLAAVTVMYQRPGFAPETNDWFWAWYMADGTLLLAEDTMPLAGNVGMCIGCHGAAPGGDWIYLNNRTLSPVVEDR